jgi:dipeptidyl aminopeptidase/acylaminoacyl peptidase
MTAMPICFVAGACASVAYAQAPAPASPAGARAMTIIDLINVPRLADPQLSPDGKQVVFERNEPDWKANKRVSHLWRSSADGRDLTQMTNGPEGETTARWSPDGKTIAFVSKRTGDEVAQVYLLPTAGGEAARLTTHESSVSRLSWSPDGATLFFLASDAKSAKDKAREKAKDDVYALDEDVQQQHLWNVTVASKAERKLTTGAFSVLSYRLSRDGSRIVNHRAPNTLYGDAEKAEIWVMKADGTEPVQVTKNGVNESNASLSPDNSQVLFVAQASGTFEVYFNGKVFVAPAAGGAAKLLLTEGPFDADRAEWSKDGKTIYVEAGNGLRTDLYTMPVAGGTLTAITSGDHAINNWTYDPAGDRHVFLQDEAANPGEVWTIAGAAGAKLTPTRATHVFDALVKGYKLPRQERIEWKGADGVTVDGLLYYPLDYQQGQKYPLIVQTHGGPAAADVFGFGNWSTYTQVLAAKGYAVLKPNYRGSTGYGDAFLRDMVGHYFKNAHLDVMAGVDKVIARGIADPDRMGKMGWSAGGHMTNKIITFTDRFKAASSGAGAANWVSMYAQSDVRTYRTPWFGGTPWQKDAPIDLYWEASPLKYVANVKTPTIFLVGKEDPRVPLPQSVEMHRGLKSNGIPTKLYIAPREPHGWQELRHQLFKVNVELEWFERYVTKHPYTWETVPSSSTDAPEGKTMTTADGSSDDRN